MREKYNGYIHYRYDNMSIFLAVKTGQAIIFPRCNDHSVCKTLVSIRIFSIDI